MLFLTDKTIMEGDFSDKGEFMAFDVFLAKKCSHTIYVAATSVNQEDYTLLFVFKFIFN